MKKSGLNGIKDSFIKLRNSKAIDTDSNGDAVYHSDAEIENNSQESDTIHSDNEHAFNKMGFKRKGNIFKALPWKWSRNLKSKRPETKIRCGLQENDTKAEYCQNHSFKSTSSAKMSTNANKCTCRNPTEVHNVGANSNTNTCDVCIVIESQNSKNNAIYNDIEDEPSGSHSETYKRCIGSCDAILKNESGLCLVPCKCKNIKSIEEDSTISALLPRNSQDHLRMGSLTQELSKLPKCGWYWGPITRNEADEKLLDQPDGAFLVRDSSDDRYLLSLSFRSCGQTLHTRIEHSNGLFSFYAQKDQDEHTSIIDLIGQSINFSQSGVYCYSRSRSPGSPSYPVRLTKPISRFTQVRSLQYLCRFVIRQYTRFDHIQKLPLPVSLKGYLEQAHY